MSKFLILKLSLQQAYIIKHTLRDKDHRDDAEDRLLKLITEQIDDRKAELKFGCKENLK